MNFFRFFNKRRELPSQGTANEPPLSSPDISQKRTADAEAIAYVPEDEPKSRHQSMIDEHADFVEQVAKKHARVLRKKIRRHLRTDDYGRDTGFNEAGEEIDYFISRVLKSEPGYKELRHRFVQMKIDIALAGKNPDEYDLDRFSIFVDQEIDENLIGFVYACVMGNECELESEVQFDVSQLSGAEFEIYCEDVLKGLGWLVHRKGGTGDQGVDLIARRGSRTIAIQCKRYAGAVGNHAVQQIEAGRQFEEADLAVVVSSGGYTRSARQLATKLNVLLLDHTELDLLPGQ